MVKPGFQWDPTAVPKPEEKNLEVTPATITLIPEPTESKSRHGHSRIPSVVLSPSPSLMPLADEKLVDIPLILDTSNLPANSGSPAPDTPYHTIISKPEFWDRLYTFLGYVLSTIHDSHLTNITAFRTEFSTKSDAAQAWEDFFCASKGTLSVSEIAKIRDKVGVIGMAGT